MTLYHYTTFANFCSIWVEQKLKFSEWTNCNDVYEREKIYHFSQQSREYNGKVYPHGVLTQFSQDVFEEVGKYKQISFCVDYQNMQGFASPMMWGHYARDYQRSGVCIEIDSSKIKYVHKGVYKGKVIYKNSLTATPVWGINAELKGASQKFVINNRKQLFFTKHPHWRPENEYRYISKSCEYLDISKAIKNVYVLGEDIVTLQTIRNMVGDTNKISFLNVGGSTLKLQEMKLSDYDELQEMMRNYNEGNAP